MRRMSPSAPARWCGPFCTTRNNGKEGAPWSNRQDRPLAKKLLHALGLLALALFLLYVAVQFVLIFHRSYKTETAIRYTLAESLNLTGVVAFDAVDVPGSGNLGYLVQDGERVTNGTVVAECYTDDTQGLQRERLDRLERSITLLDEVAEFRRQ